MTEPINIRPATVHDAELLFAWVNARESLSAKLDTTAPIAWEDHVAWLRERIADPDTYLAIACRGSTPVGQVRLQPKTGGHHIDIFVAPEARGQGVASALLRHAAQQNAWRPLIALVLSENQASQRLFEALGYRRTGSDADHVVYRLDH